MIGLDWIGSNGMEWNGIELDRDTTTTSTTAHTDATIYVTFIFMRERERERINKRQTIGLVKLYGGLQCAQSGRSVWEIHLFRL